MSVGTERLMDFPVKTTPVAADIIYVGDSADSFNEVKCTVSEIIAGYSAALASIASLTTSANQMLYTTDVDTYALTSLTPFARTLLDDTSASAMQTTLGLVIGTDVEAWSAKLDALAAQSWAADQFTYQTSTSAVANTALTSLARSLLADSTTSAMQSTLGLVIGTDVEAWSAKLDALAAQVWTADQITYQTSSSAVSTTVLSSFARTLIDDADAATARTTLGLGTAAVENVEHFAQVANNLSDLDNPVTALSNLDGLSLSGGTMTGDLILAGTPTTDLMAATRLYVDNAVQGASSQYDVRLASTANYVYTYFNGAGNDGVGATLTATAPGSVIMDGRTILLNNTVTFKDQTDSIENGIYICTNDGSVTAAEFTRASYYDSPSDIKQGSIFYVSDGDTNINSAWRESAVVNDVGVDPITFLQYTVNPAAYLQTTNNLSELTATAATARTNLGLGTVAVKTASDSSKSNASMMSGTATIGNIAVFHDTSGTIQDGGAPSQFQTANTNLTTVSSPTANAVLVSDNSSVAAWTASLTDGQILIGSTGAQPVPANLTAGSNITITNAGGSITIDSSAGGTTQVNVQTFTSSGTYTPSAGLVYAIVEVQSGGGGGGGTNSTAAGQNAVASSGAGGAYTKSLLTAAAIGASQTVTVGAAGTAGTAGGGNGGAGGTSSFGTLLVCTGGGGGIGQTGVGGGMITTIATGGAVTTAGNIMSCPGQYGACGYGSAGAGINARGGSSFSGQSGGQVGGPGGTAFASSSSGAIINAKQYGSGGAGAISLQGGGTSAGGLGAQGIVIVTEFISV